MGTPTVALVEVVACGVGLHDLSTEAGEVFTTGGHMTETPCRESCELEANGEKKPMLTADWFSDKFELLNPRRPDVKGGRWDYHEIEINGGHYEVIRRPRIFRYADWRKSRDPSYDDFNARGFLPDPDEDSNYADFLAEQEMWCFEYDVDHQGTAKTLRIECREWPKALLLIPYEDIRRPQYVDLYPEAELTYLDRELFPLCVVTSDAQPGRGVIGRNGLNVPVVSILFKRYEDEPFGMLKEERDASDGGGENRDHRRIGKFIIEKWGKSLFYNGKRYEFQGPARWKIIEQLYNGKGEYVELDATNPAAAFSGSKIVSSFYQLAVEAEGKRKAGTGKYRLVI